MPNVPTHRGSLDQSTAAGVASEPMLPEPLPVDPFPLFKRWFDAAQAGKTQPNPNAMTLATIALGSHPPRPGARIVLCKAIDLAAGHIVFYTNEHGPKGRELAADPFGAVVFHWDALDKQARIEGPIARSPASESDAYFRSRPWLSRIGAWASDQSEPVASRAELEAKLEATLRRFKIDPAALPPSDARIDIPRPPHWGGYRLYADRVELWCAGLGRLHDRAAWTRTLRSGPGGDGPSFVAASAWASTRLQP